MEKNKLLIDSCVWIAFYDIQDRQHEKAKELFLKISKKRNVYVMHYLVLIETLTILKYKGIDTEIINNIRNTIFKSNQIEVINNVNFNLPKKMWGVFEKKNKLGMVDVFILDHCLTNKYKLITFDKELNESWVRLKRGN